MISPISRRKIFYDISTQHSQSVSPCQLLEHNFENFFRKDRFCKKRKNCFKKFQVLQLQAVITLQRLHMPKTHGYMIPSV